MLSTPETKKVLYVAMLDTLKCSAEIIKSCAAYQANLSNIHIAMASSKTVEADFEAKRNALQAQYAKIVGDIERVILLAEAAQ